MLVCLTLKNKENIFVAAGIAECEEEGYPLQLDDLFNDKMVEFCWSEDQSYTNAAAIIADVFGELNDYKKKAGLIYQTDFGIDNIAEELIKSNFYNESNNSDNGMISFLEDVKNSWEDSADISITRIAEEPDPAF